MYAGTGEKPGVLRHRLAADLERRGGFTLIELLVVISIVALLMGILVPSLGKARRHAQSVLGVGDQRTIVNSLLCYAMDNDGRFPATVGVVVSKEGFWNWADPTTITTAEKLSGRANRSMSAYLAEYISDATVMTCRNAPREHQYLQDAWDAGDDWDNPDAPIAGPMSGTYCFFWNFIGSLGPDQVFRGPSGSVRGPGEGTLLVSCYLGYDHWRSRDVYSSCEKYPSASITEETWYASSYWSGGGIDEDPSGFGIKLHAGYSDGHVGDYTTSDVVPMEVFNRSTGKPYIPGVGPGVFLLPTDGVR